MSPSLVTLIVDKVHFRTWTILYCICTTESTYFPDAFAFSYSHSGSVPGSYVLSNGQLYHGRLGGAINLHAKSFNETVNSIVFGIGPR